MLARGHCIVWDARQHRGTVESVASDREKPNPDPPTESTYLGQREAVETGGSEELQPTEC